MATELLNNISFEDKECENCRKQVVVTVAENAVKSETAKATSEIANYVSIPGFRKGKVPASVLKSRYTNDIKQEVERRLVSAAYQKLSDDKTIDVLNCNVEGEVNVELDKELTFAFIVDLAPEIELGDYKAITVDVDTKEVTDAEVAERVDLYRNMYANYEDIDGAAEADDMLKVSYTSDYAVAEDASQMIKRLVASDDNFLWLKEPEMIPGANAVLIGKKANDEVKFTANFPADYREESLANAVINYELKVLAVQRKSPMTDEELAAKVQAPSFEEFTATIKSSLEQEVENSNTQKVLDAVGVKLDETVKDFELPASFLESEVNRELRKLADEIVKSEEDAEAFKANMDEHKKTAEERANKSLRRNLIIRKIAKLEDITVTEQEVDQQIQAMSAYYGYKAKDLKAMLEKNGSIDELSFNIVSAKVLQLIADSASK